MSLANGFFSRFKGLDRAHGIYTVDGTVSAKNKVGGKAWTKSQPPTPILWESHLNGDVGLGIIPIRDNDTCTWGAIDIDIYTSAFDLNKLEKEIQKLELPLVVCRTKSGGAHLYLFMSEETEAELVRKRLMEWAILLGYAGVEVFPKQTKLSGPDDTGNWLNMPYFNAEKTTRYGIKNGVKLSAEDFLAFTTAKQLSAAALKELKVESNDELKDGPPCLQQLSKKGFHKGDGVRDKGLFNLAIFAKMKYGGKWKEQLEAFNRDYFFPPLPSQDVVRIMTSVEKGKYFYQCNDCPLSNNCSKQICLTREYGVGNNKTDIGVDLNNLTKIETEPPTWILTVNGKRLQMESTESFIKLHKFREACVEKLNILPNRIKTVDWEKSVVELLERVEIIKAPDDASVRGQILALTESFCTNRTGSREDLTRGLPWHNGTYVYFKSAPLLKHLKTNGCSLSSNPGLLYSLLREKGAIHKKLTANKSTFQAWGLPKTMFSAQTEGFPEVLINDEEDF